MKLRHKEFILGIVIGGIIFGGLTIFADELLNVMVNPFKIMVNGTEKNIEGYNINGRSYFKLRDIGEQVGFDVDFKEDTILIDTSNEDDITTRENSSKNNNDDEYALMVEKMLKDIKIDIGILNDEGQIGCYYGDLNKILNNVKIRWDYIISDGDEIYYLELVDNEGNTIIDRLDTVIITPFLCLSPEYFINTVLPLDSK